MSEHLLFWSEVDDWPGVHHRMEWLCRCGAEVSVAWSSSCSLYDTDEAIEAKDANANSWQLECHNGHVLLVCHELAEEISADTYDPPTTQQIVERLASPEDVAAWRASWAEPAVEAEDGPQPKVVDLMAALEASLAAVKGERTP